MDKANYEIDGQAVADLEGVEHFSQKWDSKIYLFIYCHFGGFQIPPWENSNLGATSPLRNAFTPGQPPRHH